jgi:hypothetical protein
VKLPSFSFSQVSLLFSWLLIQQFKHHRLFPHLLLRMHQEEWPKIGSKE